MIARNTLSGNCTLEWATVAITRGRNERRASGMNRRHANAPGPEPASLPRTARKSALPSMFQAGELSRITFAAKAITLEGVRVVFSA
jgi:hypothetical protein